MKTLKKIIPTLIIGLLLFQSLYTQRVFRARCRRRARATGPRCWPDDSRALGTPQVRGNEAR